MKRGLLIILLIISTLLLTHCSKGDVVESIKNDDKLIPCKNYDRVYFEQSIMKSKERTIPPKKVFGGIVPHHLTADEYIAQFFKTIAVEQPDIVILIGPNHPNLGDKKIHTSKWNFETAYGNMNINQALTNYLINNGLAATSYELLANEHSITTLVPYIKYFIPDTEIVPIVLSSTLKQDEAIKLGELLYDQVKDKKFMVIASVDFSHYLSLEEADEKDEITKQALLNRDINRIALMNNDHLDSPASIITFLTIMNEAGSTEEIILSHTNSARILNNYVDKTTSHFTIVYN